jgi:hypothetical protein
MEQAFIAKCLTRLLGFTHASLVKAADGPQVYQARATAAAISLFQPPCDCSNFWEQVMRDQPKPRRDRPTDPLEPLCRIVLFGESGVGKTNILTRLMCDQSNDLVGTTRLRNLSENA